MKRRIFSVLLAVLLLIPWTFASAATAPVVITSEDVRGKVGDTVAVTLNVVVEPPKLNQTMDSLQFVLEYDSAALEYVSIQEVSQDRITILGAQYNCNVATNTGAVAFTAAASGGGTGSGVLMHVRFKILSAVSTMLVMKKVAYSFVTTSSGSQRGYTGGTVNLGRVTGQSAPATVAPATYAPETFSPDFQPTDQSRFPVTLEPGASPTDQPRFPVTEVTLEPGASPTEEPVEEGDSDILAYIVFGLFIVVAIMICVVLTLMIVRRGRNKMQAELLGDDEDEASFDEQDEPYEDYEYPEEEADERAYRRGYEDYEEEKPKRSKKKKKPVEYEDEEDEPPIQIVRTAKKPKKKDQ